MATMINCPYCGKLTDPKLDNCPHCGGYMKRGSGQNAVGKTGQRQTCPNCHALVQDGDIICVNCGTNLLTGQKISEEKKVMARKQRNPLWLWLLLGAIIVLGLVLLAVAYASTRRDPVDRAAELISTGDLSGAADQLSRYVETHPNDARAQFQLGKIHWLLEEYPQAARAFQAAAEIDGNRDAYMLAAVAWASTKDAQGRKSAEEVLEAMVKAYDSDADAWLLLGLARGANGDYAGQGDALEQAVRLKPDDADAHAYLGLARAMQGQYGDAAQDLNLANEGNPDNLNWKVAKAFVAARSQPESAAALLQEAATGGTSVRSLALTQLGVLLMSQGDFQGAIRYLKEAQEIDRSNEAGRLYYAVALQAVGNNEDASSLLSEISQGNGPHAAEAAALAAQGYLARQEVDKAKQAIQRAMDLGGRSAMIYTTKGRVHMRTGENNEAREAFKLALQADANYAPAYLEYGLFHVTREQAVAEGINKLQRYLELLDPAERENARPVEDLVNQLKQTGGSSPVPQEATATLGMMS